MSFINKINKMKKLTIDGKVSVNGKKSIVGMDNPVEIYTKAGVDSEIKEIKKGFIPLSGTEVGKPVTGAVEFSSLAIIEFGVGGYSLINTAQGKIEDDGGGLFLEHNTQTSIGGGNSSVSVDDIYGLLISTDIGNKGIVGKNYYGANYTDNTYVQKKYVDDNFTKVGTTAPASATAAGKVGEIRVTATFIYTCVATNTWVRAAVATW